jgi:transcriptional regulator with XRE-family HTH domain
MFIFSNMTAAQQLGAQLKAARERQRLSLRDVDKMVGIRYTTISGYEAGTSVPTADKLAKLALALNLHFVEIDSCRFWISRVEPVEAAPVTGEQLSLDFTGEYSYSRASLKISPGRITVVFDAVRDRSQSEPKIAPV